MLLGLLNRVSHNRLEFIDEARSVILALLLLLTSYLLCDLNRYRIFSISNRLLLSFLWWCQTLRLLRQLLVLLALLTPFRLSTFLLLFLPLFFHLSSFLSGCGRLLCGLSCSHCISLGLLLLRGQSLTLSLLILSLLLFVAHFLKNTKL